MVKIYMFAIIVMTVASSNAFAQVGTRADNPMVGGAAMYKTKNIVENAVNSQDHTTLVAAIKAAGLVDTLTGKGPFTVFAPTNEAFDRLPAGTVNMLLTPENKHQLTEVLTYHLVAGKYDSKKLMKLIEQGGGSAILKTVSGNILTVSMNDTNTGITLTDARGATSIVTIADVYQSNGVIHVVDTVLSPSFPHIDIVDNAAHFAELTMQVEALKAAGLFATLKGEGPFTIFSPTNDAYRKLPIEMRDSLLKPENKDRLAMILNYHVVVGKYDSKKLRILIKQGGGSAKLKTVSGRNLIIKINHMNNGIILVDERKNTANVTSVDNYQSNGILYIIDTVLMPSF